MSQPTLFPTVYGLDTTASRHGGNANSEAAHDRIADSIPERRRVVLEAIRAAGQYGLTVDELAGKWGVGANVISGRFTELKAAGSIAEAGRRKTRGGNTATAWKAV